MPSLLRSYLFDRYFNIKVDKDNTNYHLIQAGIVQDSVLGPFLYLMYTADIPTRDETDMEVCRRHSNLDLLQKWLQKWKIKVNSGKSAQNQTQFISSGGNQQSADTHQRRS